MQPQRRKRSRFGDAPPAAPGLTAGVPAAANAAAAAAVQAMVNQNMLGSGGGTDNGASSSQALKVKTELFVGNIPAGCEGVALTEFLNGAMIAVNLNIGDGNPITEARITAKFAFIVLRTPEETTNALNLTGIPYNECVLKVERPAGYPGVKTGTLTWARLANGERPPDPTTVQRQQAAVVGPDSVSTTALALLTASTSGAGLLLSSAPVLDPATKAARELFIGNITETSSGDDIKDFLGSVMEEVGLSDAKIGGNPIVNVRVSPKFAFIELRSIEETSNALNMDGIPYGDLELRIKRPEKFPGNPTPSVTWREFLELRNEALTMRSTLISLSGEQLIRPGELQASDESKRSVFEDIRSQCMKHGTVVEVIAPQSGVASDMNYRELRASMPVAPIIHVRFQTHEEAQTATAEVSKMTFAGGAVDVVVSAEREQAET